MKSMFAFAVALAACGASQKDVAVGGSDTELVKLAGEWQGEYQGKDSGRTGTVSFSLLVGHHVAQGEVVMNRATPLKIEFVKLQGTQLKGTIAPYTDPACSCQVETSFLGTVSGDTISGMFETKVAATGTIQTGTWSATRKAAP